MCSVQHKKYWEKKKKVYIISLSLSLSLSLYIYIYIWLVCHVSWVWSLAQEVHSHIACRKYHNGCWSQPAVAHDEFSTSSYTVNIITAPPPKKNLAFKFNMKSTGHFRILFVPVGQKVFWEGFRKLTFQSIDVEIAYCFNKKEKKKKEKKKKAGVNCPLIALLSSSQIFSPGRGFVQLIQQLCTDRYTWPIYTHLRVHSTLLRSLHTFDRKRSGSRGIEMHNVQQSQNDCVWGEGGGVRAWVRLNDSCGYSHWPIWNSDYLALCWICIVIWPASLCSQGLGIL